MQEKKIISLSFNRRQFITDQKNIWKFTSGKALKSYIIYTALGLIFLAINLKTDSLGQLIAAGFLFYMLLAWIGLIERWIKFSKSTKIYADKFEKENMTCTYTFSDNGIRYEDQEKLYQLSWHLFKPFEAYKDNIYIKLKDQAQVTFILSRQELGDDQYHEVYTILEEKIG